MVVWLKWARCGVVRQVEGEKLVTEGEEKLEDF